MFKRIILLVMDSVGIGHAVDAVKFGDEGSNTLGHIESTAGQIHCPNLKSFGLGRIADISDDGESIKGAFGRMAELSTGKDTTSGHWEMMGHPLPFHFQPFMKAFQKN